jgi:hypothetical protein
MRNAGVVKHNRLTHVQGENLFRLVAAYPHVSPSLSAAPAALRYAGCASRMWLRVHASIRSHRSSGERP